MATTRGKRWNGKFDSLPATYLKGVIEKMQDYGDRVQFSLVSKGPQPSYQLLTEAGKQMAFDGNHHLLSAQEGEFAGANASPIVSMDQLKAIIAGTGSAPKTGARATKAAGTGGGRTSAAKLEEQFAAQRYEYFKNNRQSLPAGISDYTDEITGLMKTGKSAEEAFGEVLSKYF